MEVYYPEWYQKKVRHEEMVKVKVAKKQKMLENIKTLGKD